MAMAHSERSLPSLNNEQFRVEKCYLNFCKKKKEERDGFGQYRNKREDSKFPTIDFGSLSLLYRVK